MILFESLLGISPREMIARVIELQLFEIVKGGLIEGRPMDIRTRIQMLRHMRRAWDREEARRCEEYREMALRAGFPSLPGVRPWPRLLELPAQMQEIALARSDRWQARFMADPFRPLARRLEQSAARARQKEALRIALREIDSAFPSTSPKRSN